MTERCHCSMCGKSLALHEQILEEHTERTLCRRCDAEMESAEDLLSEFMKGYGRDE